MEVDYRGFFGRSTGLKVKLSAPDPAHTLVSTGGLFMVVLGVFLDFFLRFEAHPLCPTIGSILFVRATFYLYSGHLTPEEYVLSLGRTVIACFASISGRFILTALWCHTVYFRTTKDDKPPFCSTSSGGKLAFIVGIILAIHSVLRYPLDLVLKEILALVGAELRLRPHVWDRLFRSKEKFYKHQSLKPGEIRLLSLKKWRPFCGVRASLEAMDLSKHYPYVAISYTWGSADQTHEIKIDGMRCKVTKATYEALHDCSSFYESRHIWIDYVCIDQGNVEEKNKQVAMMREIYEKAGLVVVWLGGSSKRSARAGINFIEELAEHANNPTIVDIHYNIERLRLTAKFTSLIKLLNHPWFTRIWVVQEVAVATNVQVVYGGLPIAWETFTAIPSLFLDPQMAALLQVTVEGKNAYKNLSQFEEMQNLQRFRRIYKKAEQSSLIGKMAYASLGLAANPSEISDDSSSIAESLSIRHLLTTCINFDSTDPRDKVFALFGLASDSFKLPFKPNYSKPVTEVFTDTASYLLSKKYPYNILSFAGIGYNRKLEGLPSWVPDWTNPPDCAPLTSPTYMDELNRTAYHAGGTEKSTTKSHQGSRIIELNAIIVDRIAHLASVCNSRFDDDDFYTDSIGNKIHAREAIASSVWHDEIWRLARNEASVYGTGDQLVDAFWRTLCGNRTPGAYPAPQTLYRDYEKWVAVQEYLRDYLVKEERGNLPSSDEFWAWVQDTAVFGTALGTCAAGRRLCVTQNGYLGMVPPGSRVGDAVGIFVGTPAPCILRPLGSCTSCYELVGVAYVHEMMDGEMMSKYKPTTIQLV